MDWIRNELGYFLGQIRCALWMAFAGKEFSIYTLDLMHRKSARPVESILVLYCPYLRDCYDKTPQNSWRCHRHGLVVSKLTQASVFYWPAMFTIHRETRHAPPQSCFSLGYYAVYFQISKEPVNQTKVW
jgi:hypothetical protein